MSTSSHPFLIVIMVFMVFMFIAIIVGLKIVSDREVDRLLEKYDAAGRGKGRAPKSGQAKTLATACGSKDLP